jgi:hypothetical protein
MSVEEDLRLVRKAIALLAVAAKSGTSSAEEVRDLERGGYNALSRVEKSGPMILWGQYRVASQRLRELRGGRTK